MTDSRYDLVVVGASWGGLVAVRSLLHGLPSTFRTPVVIAQHRGTDSIEGALVELLGAVTRLSVSEASDKDPIEAGHVYVAPPDYHLLVERGRTFALTTDERINFARPSIDELFETAVDEYGDRVVGVVLTGANEDGAAGLACVSRAGGAAIVQDPATAERPEMPKAALRAVPDARVLPVDEIAAELVRLCQAVALR